MYKCIYIGVICLFTAHLFFFEFFSFSFNIKISTENTKENNIDDIFENEINNEKDNQINNEIITEIEVETTAVIIPQIKSEEIIKHERPSNYFDDWKPVLRDMTPKTRGTSKFEPM